MEIRLLNEEDDIDAVCGIYAASWKSTYRGIIPQEFLDNIDKEKWREGIQNSELISLVMMNGEKMIGTASYCASRFISLKGFGEIVSLYLLPDYYGNGYGRQLLQAAVDGLSEMGFSEKVKEEAKRKSDFRCVICQEPFVEVHHIIPQNEGDEDTIENAAPLCSRCHDLYGDNPAKRKQIPQMRDYWFEVMEKRNKEGLDALVPIASDPDRVNALRDKGIAIQHTVFAESKGIKEFILLFTISFFFLTQYISIYLTANFHNSKFIMDQRAEKSPLLVNAAAAGVIGPATEELLFRRFLYKGLKSMGKEKSSLISSVIFGLCHRHVIQGIYAALWGNVFYFVYEKHHSLKAPFSAHMISNLLSFLPILWISLNHCEKEV